MAKFKTLQNPWAEGLGNDYEQDLSYVVTKDKKGKTTWRDGIYTKLAQDVKDPEGLNKRTVFVKQDKFVTLPDGIELSALSGETDGSAIFTAEYATGVSFGYPFSATSAVAEDYYSDKTADNDFTGIDVADFRVVSATDKA